MPTLRSSFPVSASNSDPNWFDLAKPTGTVANDLLLLQINTNNDIVPTPPEGFILVPGASVTGVTTTIRIYQKIAGGSEPSTYRIYFPTGNVVSAGMIAIDAASLAYPIVHAVATNQSATPSTSKVWSAVTNVDANTLLLCFGAFATAGGSTVNAGMTERWDEASASTRPYLMTQAVAGTGTTGTRTATGTSATLIRTITISVSESATLPFAQEFPELNVTALPVLIELGGEGVDITSFPTLVEIGAVGIYVTQLCVLVEFEEHVESGGIVPVYRPHTAGSRALHKILPNEVTGYAFDPEYSWWTIVVPEQTENLIINPSFEVYDTYGYDWPVLGWNTVTVVDDGPVGATRALRCLKLIGNSLGDGEIYYEGDVVAGFPLHVTPGPYTWSLDIYASHPNSAFELEMRYTGGSTIKKRRYQKVGSGWKRYEMTYIEAGTGDIELVFRDVGSDGLLRDIYYLDAWQFEKKLYATTYADGDMVGFYDTRPSQSYFWRGLPNRSSSIRRASTASGGREVSFSSDFGLFTTGIIGLGMGPIEHDLQELASGKELHRGSRDVPRDFTITARLFAENWNLLSQKKHELIRLIRPNSTPEREPLLLRYQPTDDTGKPYGVPLEIICAYSSGLQGNVTNLYQETLAMQFHASNPFLAETIDSAAELLVELSLPSTGAVYRDEDMEYQSVEVGASGGADFSNFAQMTFSYNGAIVAAIEVIGDTGDLDIAGISRTSNVLLATPDINGSHEWNSIESNAVIEGLFYALESARTSGFIVLGGDFDYVDGADEWHNIAVYLILENAIEPPGLIKINNMDAGLNDAVYAIDHHSDNNYYVGGAFTDEDGVVGVGWNHIFRLMTDEGLGEAFSQEVLGGADATVYAVKSDGARYIYIGGEFNNVYAAPAEVGPIGVGKVAAYDTLEDEWVVLGNDVNHIGVNGTVYDIDIAPDGSVYIIGTFLTHGTPTVLLDKIGRWNGYSWVQPFAFGALWDGDLAGIDARFEIAPDGILWFYSRDPLHGYVDVPTVGDCWLFGWKDGIFYAPFYEIMDGSQGVSDLRFLPTGEALITFRELGSSTRVPYLNRVSYYGGADSYPTLILTSAHPQFIINHSCSAAIYFREDATLNDLERMHIVLSSLRANVFSNRRDEMSNFIQTGATNIDDFRLIPGVNRISCFMRSAISGDEAAIVWRNQFWSIDATVANELLR